jgi:peptidoglycan/LPS O-acetylase OafA/YrhL
MLSKLNKFITLRSQSIRAKLALVALLVVAMLMTTWVLESQFGVSADTSHRVYCALGGIIIIYSWGFDEPNNRWLRFALPAALLANIGIFFTPLVDRPVSEGRGGDFLLFVLPSIVIMFSTRIAMLPVNSVRDRATRQELILWLVVAVIVCAVIFAIALREAR